MASADVPTDPIPLWPGVPPGDGADIGEEKDTTKPGQDPAGKTIIRLGNVSKPTIQIFKPAKEKDTGAAVVVCPGGGYYILAMDLEGTEVCKWLNSVGVTAVLLKYRVPVRKDRPRYAAPLQDAQRALGMTRWHAKEWGIDPTRIGILGFSAGGHLSAAASTNYENRAYPVVDQMDKESCRPDFTVLIYPAYLTEPATSLTLAPELKVTSQTPPAFIAMTQDDPIRVETAIGYALALKDAKVPFELHVYPKGGHGYGLRPTESKVTTWPARVAEWMTFSGLLKK
jgi:acetyl esterase/lipase